MNYPKILVCCPTAKVKNYTWEKWIESVMAFSWPNFQIYMVDNTMDGGKNAAYLNEYFLKYYGDIPGKFLAVHSGTDNIKSVIKRLEISHNMCAMHAKKNKYTHIFHLESDIIADHDTLERLFFNRKQVTGALYYRDSGIYRKIMCQRHQFLSPEFVITENYTPEEDINFIDGTLKPVAHIGLGAILIHTSTFDKINFRSIPGQDIHPDTYFAEDCYKHKIKIWVDTSLLCTHNDQPWGIFGVDYF